MTKINRFLLLFLVIQLGFSCKKEEISIPKIAIIAKNPFTNEELYDFTLSTKWYVGGGGLLYPITYDRDTILLDEEREVIKEDLFHDRDCISDVYLSKEHYHSLEYYESYCKNHADTLFFDLKPLKDLEVRIHTNRELDFLEIRTLRPLKDELIKKSNRLIGEAEIGCVSDDIIFGDTIVTLPVIQQDTVSIYIRYNEGFHWYSFKDTIITDMSRHFYKDISF